MTRSSKLTPMQVLEIREKYWQQNMTQGALCREYNVSIITIGRIVRGESHKALPGPGYHAGATEIPVEQNLKQAAEDYAIMRSPVTVNEADIAASFALLQQKLGIKPKVEEPDDGEAKE